MVKFLILIEYVFFFILFVTFFCLDGFSKEIITIEIDGSNLPDESGTLSKGKEIYLKSCSKCHGYSGEGLYGPELVGRSSLDQKNTSKRIGNFWPYAPKIFDYVKRAKRKENKPVVITPVHIAGIITNRNASNCVQPSPLALSFPT